MKNWISAFRLRTLPLSLSSIILGSFLAIKDGVINYNILSLALITTVLLQILSNLANDYGDGVKGTDNAERLGPERAVQSGAISQKQMRNAVIVFALLSLFSGIFLLMASFSDDFNGFITFLVFGLFAIAAAIMYTVGKNAYGYLGLGDLFVFIFFGLLGTLGTYYLYTHTFNWVVLFPAASIGFLSTGVLNLNNTRDIENDIKSGKHTLASKLGRKKAIMYQSFLLAAAIICAALYNLVQDQFGFYQWMFMIVVIPLFNQFQAIQKVQNDRDLDPFLKQLAITTFVFSIIFGVGQII